MLVYFMVMWYILCAFGIFLVIWYILCPFGILFGYLVYFPRFDMLYQNSLTTLGQTSTRTSTSGKLSGTLESTPQPIAVSWVRPS
jgi:hypothetical protein